ncbi:hypothetical protein CLOSTASPAR_03583 [[Clostridium] asparagiforme DSM 15981]|uniref:Uncharacterized protein n=1 Tax=[Clostridium] asparagiforme DSM 15981 TaxID=518636 RepID=C0D2U4_9FIRM|nr:hypothetical protein CLOSTASPAR_03583 [[Clostridium] asparagiforme DSM 15981]
MYNGKRTKGKQLKGEAYASRRQKCMRIRKILGGVAWFMLAAGLVLFNAVAADAQVTEPYEVQNTVCRTSCETP